MCTYGPEDIHVDTVENYEKHIEAAKENIEAAGLDGKITLIEGDAGQVIEELEAQRHSYDMIFIDAAKAQSRKFFEKYSPLIKMGGFIIIDNIIFHGLDENDASLSKNLRSMLKKIRLFVEWLKTLPNYEVTFFEGGDGLAITRKQC